MLLLWAVPSLAAAAAVAIAGGCVRVCVPKHGDIQRTKDA